MRSWPILDGALHLATCDLDEDGVAVTGGACDTDPVRARLRASAEATERHALLLASRSLAVSADELGEDAVRVLPPAPRYAGERWWVVGRTHPEGDPVGVLARAVLLGWTGGVRLEWKQSSSGTALRHDPEDAYAAALAETLERYAVRQLWRGELAVTEIDGLYEMLPTGLTDAFTASGVRAHAWHLHTGLPIAVVVAALTRQDREQITFGAGAGPLGKEPAAVEHAVLEAVSVRAALAGSGLPRDATDADAVRRTALTRQTDFLRHMASVTAPPGGAPDARDLTAAVRDRFGVPVVRVDLTAGDDQSLVRVHVPHEDFLTPLPGRGGYRIAPGYLE